MHNILHPARANQRATRWLLLCGVAAPPVALAFLVAAGLLTPGYSHLSDAVSQLGAPERPHPEVMNAGLIIYGLLLNGFAYGLYRQLDRRRGAKVIWLLLGMSGAGILLAGIFHVDPTGLEEGATLDGIIHAVVAQVAFVTFLGAVGIFARAVHLDPAWRGFTGFSLALAVVDLAVACVFWTDVFEGFTGALQRSFFAVSMLWLEAVALWSLRLGVAAARPGPARPQTGRLPSPR